MIKGERVSGQKSKTILIVEDDPKNMKLFRDILSFKGYSILEAVTGEQGVALAREYNPDLILMDVQLPLMDGIEATRIIRADESGKSAVIIGVTADAMPGIKEKMLAAGCEDYISKPVHLEKFLQKISGYLDQKVLDHDDGGNNNE